MFRMFLVLLLVVFTASAHAGGLEEGLAAHAKQDYVTAAKLWTPLAERGDAAAQNGLGVAYLKGEGVDKDIAVAVNWFEKSADQGHADALVNLADIYFDGVGVKKDVPLALKYLERAAERDHVTAQTALGIFYSQGRGVAKDSQKALYWLTRAANADYVKAISTLWLLHVEADRLPVAMQAELTGKIASLGLSRFPSDSKKAFAWAKRAAELGHAASQMFVGILYAEGLGTAKDDSAALYWYRKAADQGFPKSQNPIALAYLDGRGVAKNEQEAFAWFQKGADQGDPDSQNALGVMYADGVGIAQSSAWAVYWFALAAQQGFSISPDNIESVISDLPTHQIAEYSVAVRAQPAREAAVVIQANLNQTVYRLRDAGNGWLEVYLRQQHAVGYIEQSKLRKRDSAPVERISSATSNRFPRSVPSALTGAAEK